MAKRCAQPSCSSSSQPSISLSPRQQFASHMPRLLDRQGEPLVETVSRTARVPPPKILPSAVRRADSFTTSPHTVQVPSIFYQLMFNNTYGNSYLLMKIRGRNYANFLIFHLFL